LADTFPPLPSNSNQQQQRQQEDQIIVTVQNKSGTLAQDEVRWALKKLTIQ
jgi:biopolymer transport protein ExbD